jgi:hypothetical protein
MRQTIAIAGLALAAAGCTAAEPPEARLDREAALSAELSGHEPAGPAQACVSTREIEGNHSAGGAIIFEGHGGRLWVNRPSGGCPDLRHNALTVRASGSQLCRGDIATVVDLTTGVSFGGCGLGAFEPYRRSGG